MTITPIDILITLGRKLEALKQADAEIELSKEALAGDKDLNALIPFALMIGDLVEALGFEPLNEMSWNQEYLNQLKETCEKYLPK